jgi:hypothetical protein
MITLGKKGDLPAYRRANGFILKPSLVPRVFGEFAKRYAERPGGYTRIHKYGNRQGDNAPHAILELVDNPRDIRYEMTAMSVGWDILSKRVGRTPGKNLVNEGVSGVEEIVEKGREHGHNEVVLRERTRWNLEKVLRYKDEQGVKDLVHKAESHIVREFPQLQMFESLTVLRTHCLQNRSPSVTSLHGEARRKGKKAGLVLRQKHLLPNPERRSQVGSEVPCTWRKGFWVNNRGQCCGCTSGRNLELTALSFGTTSEVSSTCYSR